MENKTSRIKSVFIKKLWGVKNIETEFNKNVNIFIGVNGTSKTTFLNLIEATLLCDLKTLYNIEFEEIKIELVSSEYADNMTMISVKKLYDISSDKQYFQYNIAGKDYEIIYSNYRYRTLRPGNSKFYDEYLTVKSELSSLLNISWLSINRSNISYDEYYDRREYSSRLINTIDKKIEDLVEKLIGYNLQLEAEVTKSIDLFKKESLLLMLFDSSCDKIDLFNLKKQEQINDLRIELYNAFNALEIKNKNAKIQQHIAKINDVYTKLINKIDLKIEDALVLPLINRTFSMLDLFKEYENKKKDMLKPLNMFWRSIEEFMDGKTFKLDTNNGKIKIGLNEGNDEDKDIDITYLSSGEKQLFILLAETLLQKGATHLFIADEPELSLHIGWQRIILEKILELNPNAQLIVATHSPEIASSFPDNIINMKSITSYE
jgi:predicted ATPase